MWGRYDAPGHTLYVAEGEETAYAEVLAPFKRQLGASDPLEADAAALGLTRDEFLELVAEEWSERAFMGVGAIPRQWRVDRAIYRIYNEGSGWLIDVEHPETIAWLERGLALELSDEGVHSLTTAILRGESRQITTMIGNLLRGQIIDTGEPAAGIQYGSKFGAGWCRAIWAPDPEDDRATDLIELSGESILATDEHLARACEWFRIRAF